MRGDPLKSFEEFESLDQNPLVRPKVIRENGGPNAVRVENGACLPVFCGRAVKQSLRAGFRLVGRIGNPFLVYDDKVVRLEMPFVLAACRHQQSERIALDHHAVVARSSKGPASGPKLVSCATKPFDR